MYASQITDELRRLLIVEKKAQAVLFDGTWGCGKTFGVNTFIENEKIVNHIYISLFGLKTGDDIVLRLSERLDSRFIATVNGHSFLVDSPNERPFCCTLIIFDNLERKDADLSYMTIFGIIDDLRRLGFLTVCLVSSGDISDKDFFTHLDKTFDRKINVVADPLQVPNVLPGFTEDSADALLRLAKNNWRLLKRAQQIYKNIVSRIEETGHQKLTNETIPDKSSFFRCIVMALRCSFSANKMAPSFGSDDTYNKIRYETNLEKLGLYASNELYQLFYEEKVNANLRDLTENLIPCIESNNYNDLFDSLFPSASAAILNEFPFNQEPYFLSDIEKENTKTQFLARLSDFDFSENSQKQYLGRILSVFITSLTEEEKNRIIERIVQTVPYEQSDNYLWMLFGNPGDNPTQLRSFQTTLKKRFSEINKIKRADYLDKILSEKDYVALTDFLFKNKYLTSAEKDTIGQQLAEHGFALPDLSATISYSSWQYCHEIVSFIADIPSLYETFLSELDGQCAKSKSISLRQRCNDLTQKISGAGLDFFEKWPL